MQQEPTIVERTEQPYVAIRSAVTMDTLGEFAQRHGEVYSWMAARNVLPVGAPFLRYDVIDAQGELLVELGVPVEQPHAGEEEIIAGVLPAGRYVRVPHVGHPDELPEATRELVVWADEQGLEWDADGNEWGCRLEVYKTDPWKVADLSSWETELLFRLRD